MILQCRDWKRNGRRIVLVSGHFALLHPGHIRLLEQARSHGDILVVALASDAAPGSPEILQSLAPLAERAEILAALAAVDFVTDFAGSSADLLIAKLSPEVVVAGAANSFCAPPGQGIASPKSGGPLFVRLPLEPGYSTELLLERIAQLPA